MTKGKQSISGIPVVERAWMPKDESVLLVNGIDALYTYDGTNRQTKATLQMPKAVMIVNFKRLTHPWSRGE